VACCLPGLSRCDEDPCFSDKVSGDQCCQHYRTEGKPSSHDLLVFPLCFRSDRMTAVILGNKLCNRKAERDAAIFSYLCRDEYFQIPVSDEGRDLPDSLHGAV